MKTIVNFLKITKNDVMQRSLYMTDDEIVKLVWGVMVLKRRFEDDPYSLSVDEIEQLRDNENRRYIWHYVSQSRVYGGLGNICDALLFMIRSHRKDTWPITRIKGVLHLPLSVSLCQNQNALTATDT